MSGDLGVGKTVFTQGFAAGLGVEDNVNSPTFTIVNEYNTPKFNIYHFDVYRLADIDEFYSIGGEEYFENGVSIIEWGELIEEALPKDYLKIKFSRLEENENSRILEFYENGQFKINF